MILPASMYMTTYTMVRYTAGDPGGIQMKDRPLMPRFPTSCASLMAS